MFGYIDKVVRARDAQPENGGADLVMRSVQRRCHRLVEAAAAAWAAAGAPRRGATVSAVSRAYARLAAAYGAEAPFTAGGVLDAAWNKMEYGWSELSSDHRYCVPMMDAGCEPRNELYRAAAHAAADLLEAGDRLEQLLLTEEEEWAAHPEWADKPSRW